MCLHCCYWFYCLYHCNAHYNTLTLCTHTSQQTFNHYGIPPSELLGAVPKYFPASDDDVYVYNGRSYNPKEQKDILASVQSAYYFSIAGTSFQCCSIQCCSILTLCCCSSSSCGELLCASLVVFDH
jgi:hypothetical protein